MTLDTIVLTLRSCLVLEYGEPFGTKSSSAPVSTSVSEISGCQASSHIGEPILILPTE